MSNKQLFRNKTKMMMKKRRAKKRKNIEKGKMKKIRKIRRKRIKSPRKRNDYKDVVNMNKISISSKFRAQIVGSHFPSQSPEIHQTSCISVLNFFFLFSDSIPGLLLFFVQSFSQSVEILMSKFFVRMRI